jgi:signal transduction histidine kinase
MADATPRELLRRESSPPLASTASACGVAEIPIERDPGRSSSRLAVGGRDGSLMLLSYSAEHWSFVIQTHWLDGGSIDDIQASMASVLPAARPSPLFLAVSGTRVSVIELETGTIHAALDLPESRSAYRLVAPRSWTSTLAWDGHSGHLLTPGFASGRFALSAEPMGLRNGAIGIGTSDDEVLVVYDDAVTHLRETGDKRVVPIVGRERRALSLPRVWATTRRLIAMSYEPPPVETLTLLRRQRSAWHVAAEVESLPGFIATAASLGDSTIVLGGGEMNTADPKGWLAVVDNSGRIRSQGEHPTPVRHLEPVGALIAAHGAASNLSVYSADLRPLWDGSSPTRPVGLASGDFDADGTSDLAVVGVSLDRAAAWQVDSLRFHLARPDLLADATRDGDALVDVRNHVTLYLNQTGRLEEALIFSESAARRWIERGQRDSAVMWASRARGCAATLGDTAEVRAMTALSGSALGVPARIAGTLAVSSVLIAAALGLTLGRSRLRGGWRPAAIVAALLAAGICAWLTIGQLPHSPLLLAGAVCAGGISLTRSRSAPRARRPGATIERLADATLAFIHGSKGEFRDSGEGAKDFARKNLTKLAYLSEGMLNARDDRSRYEKLEAMLRRHAETFDRSVLPQGVTIARLAAEVGFGAGLAQELASSLEALSGTLADILGNERAEPGPRAHLEALVRTRKRAVSAADALWDTLQKNPGCSLTSVLDDVVQQMQDAIDGAGATLDLTNIVSEETDAVALQRFELFNIIENLLTNALSALRSSMNKRITVTAEHRGDTIVIRVADTGAGMTPEQAERAFREKRHARLGGFGLPYSRRVLRSHGGDLRIEATEPGKGTTFALTLLRWTARVPGDDHGR